MPLSSESELQTDTKGQFSSGLRTAKMDDNFLAKRMHDVALARRNDDGIRLWDHLYKVAAGKGFRQAVLSSAPSSNPNDRIGPWSP